MHAGEGKNGIHETAGYSHYQFNKYICIYKYVFRHTYICRYVYTIYAVCHCALQIKLIPRQKWKEIKLQKGNNKINIK